MGSACPATHRQVGEAHGIIGECHRVLVDVLVNRQALHGLNELGRHAAGVGSNGVSAVAPDSSWHGSVDEFEHRGRADRPFGGGCQDYEEARGRLDKPFWCRPIRNGRSHQNGFTSRGRMPKAFSAPTPPSNACTFRPVAEQAT
jgi:hypothetical protein